MIKTKNKQTSPAAQLLSTQKGSEVHPHPLEVPKTMI